MLSAINDDGDNCEKLEDGRQNSTTCSVKYSTVGSETDGAELSLAAIAVLGACSVLL